MGKWADEGGEDPRAISIEFALLLALHIALFILSAFALATPAEAHPGRTAADDCHYDRKNGGRHCDGSQQSERPARQPFPGKVYNRNYSAVGATGAALILIGQPGYASHLYRDGNGVACE